jgi:hypothetical protein
MKFGGKPMPDFEKMYFNLFNAITDALIKLEAHNYGDAVELLRKSQTISEELYMNDENQER